MDDFHMPPSDDDVTALVGSRLCHDLISPLGAIGNGVELLQMTGDAFGPELALISDAVRDAQARIRFFRIAFGNAGPAGRVSPREIAEILGALYGPHGRLTVTWTPQADLPRRRAKSALLALACAETALPMGGAIRIDEGDGALQVTATGPRIVAEPDLWAVLDSGKALRPVDPAEVQFILLAQAAEAEGLAITCDLQADKITIRL
ncbi:MAG: histidine phosphotransferase family protein [Pseudomonadota bacterium]